ncbi:MAG TPA: CoA pyrophosphatase [Thermotogota bacterium]|nr:CoA pyrophosphatase [Thermotogota bacterium]HPJ87875.1 CoA pyrophosphatase [Thermotogota bacterium]HPR94968.1 CoA pyrophosphatase [Thermotogota bacterium]
MKRITSTVLVSLFRDNGEYSLLFTERSKSLKHHPGEISFPGGRIEKGEDPADAVRRETEEEINAEIIRILDSLNPVMTLVSNHTILPYIGVINIDHIQLNEDEVEKIHTITLPTFLTSKMKMKRFAYRDKYISSPVWDFDSFFVWGATGRILQLFQEWLRSNHDINGTSVL